MILQFILKILPLILLRISPDPFKDPYNSFENSFQKSFQRSFQRSFQMLPKILSSLSKIHSKSFQRSCHRSAQKSRQIFTDLPNEQKYQLKLMVWSPQTMKLTEITIKTNGFGHQNYGINRNNN